MSKEWSDAEFTEARTQSRSLPETQTAVSLGKGESWMATSLVDSIVRISAPDNLDASVDEVFGTVLGWKCLRDTRSGTEPQERESVTAVVGFGGLLSGACIVRAGCRAAQIIAGRMTGAEVTEIDETVQDGIGELCNMVAGTWKGRVPELAANCALSVPTVITGRDYHVHVQTPKFELHHFYRWQEVSFEVIILCDAWK